MEPVAARLGVTVAVLTLVPTVMVGDPLPVVGVPDGPDVGVGDVVARTVPVLVACPVTVAVPAGVEGVSVGVPAEGVSVGVPGAGVADGVAGSTPPLRSARISPAPNISV